jgi:hypothetical protein
MVSGKDPNMIGSLSAVYAAVVSLSPAGFFDIATPAQIPYPLSCDTTKTHRSIASATRGITIATITEASASGVPCREAHRVPLPIVALARLAHAADAGWLAAAG